MSSVGTSGLGAESHRQDRAKHIDCFGLFIGFVDKKHKYTISPALSFKCDWDCGFTGIISHKATLAQAMNDRSGGSMPTVTLFERLQLDCCQISVQQER